MVFLESGILRKWDLGKVRFGKGRFWESGILGKWDLGKLGFLESGIVGK